MKASWIVVGYTLEDPADALAEGVNILPKLISREFKHKAIEMETGPSNQELCQCWKGPGGGGREGVKGLAHRTDEEKLISPYHIVF